MQRETRKLLLFTVHNDVLPVKAEVCVLRCDKQSVEQFLHGVSSMLSRR